MIAPVQPRPMITTSLPAAVWPSARSPSAGTGRRYARESRPAATDRADCACRHGRDSRSARPGNPRASSPPCRGCRHRSDRRRNLPSCSAGWSRRILAAGVLELDLVLLEPGQDLILLRGVERRKALAREMSPCNRCRARRARSIRSFGRMADCRPLRRGPVRERRTHVKPLESPNGPRADGR